MIFARKRLDCLAGVEKGCTFALAFGNGAAPEGAAEPDREIDSFKVRPGNVKFLLKICTV